MKIACIDLEGVLIPELWPIIAKRSGIEELSITTREFPDYNSLMNRRIHLLSQNSLKLMDIKKVLEDINPYPDAVEFIKKLSDNYYIHIVSDCFYEIASPFLNLLGNPAAFLHNLIVDENNWVVGCKWQGRKGKQEHVNNLIKNEDYVIAVGDAFNDIEMLKSANKGFLIRPSVATKGGAGDIPIIESLFEVFEYIPFKSN